MVRVAGMLVVVVMLAVMLVVVIGAARLHGGRMS